MDNPTPDPTDTAKPIVAQASETLKVSTGDSPGWKTTEFWLHAVVIVGIVATALAGAGLPPKWAAGCVVAATASYGIARGLAKMGNSN